MNNKLNITDDIFEINKESFKKTSYVRAFTDLYYHLYSNSDASRAERIFEDIGKLLLIKILVDKSNGKDKLNEFQRGLRTANEIFLPILVERFPKILSREDHFTLGDDALREGLRQLDKINLAEAPAYVLGEAFQAVIGPRLRGEKGQFFTPRSLVKAMVKVASPDVKDKVVDPAAGTGSFLVESHVFRKEKYPNASSYGPLVGLERDRDLYRLGSSILNIVTDGVGCIYQANSLDVPALQNIEEPSPLSADIVLTNPPFGAKIGITDAKLLSHFSLGNNWAFAESDNCWHRLSEFRRAQDPQLLFLDLCLQLLKPGGLLGIVLPEGIFGNRKSGYVWDFIRSHGQIEAMIDCPRTTFQPSTDTKTNVVFIRKNYKRKTSMTKTLIAVAKSCGHDRRGRVLTANGTAVADELLEVSQEYGTAKSKKWLSCEITDPYYIVPRFYHAGAKNAVVGIAKEWGSNTVTIGELLKEGSLVIRKGHEVGADAYGTGDIPFVRTSDISNWEISINPTNGVSEEIYQQYYSAQNIKPYDILLVVDGRYRIGRTAILQPKNTKIVIQSHFRIITVKKKSPINCYELLYLFNMQSVLEEVRNLIFIQSTLGSIGKRLAMLQLPLPRNNSDWIKRIEQFRGAIEGRAKLLEKLKEFEAPEIEL